MILAYHFLGTLSPPTCLSLSFPTSGSTRRSRWWSTSTVSSSPLWRNCTSLDHALSNLGQKWKVWRRWRWLPSMERHQLVLFVISQRKTGWYTSRASAAWMWGHFGASVPGSPSSTTSPWKFKGNCEGWARGEGGGASSSTALEQASLCGSLPPRKLSSRTIRETGVSWNWRPGEGNTGTIVSCTELCCSCRIICIVYCIRKSEWLVWIGMVNGEPSQTKLISFSVTQLRNLRGPACVFTFVFALNFHFTLNTKAEGKRCCSALTFVEE